jgi:hypothetical protein
MLPSEHAPYDSRRPFTFTLIYKPPGFRNGGSEGMDRRGVPQWLRSTYQGHTAEKALQMGAGGHGDSQLKSYSQKLGSTVEDLFKMAMILSCVPRDTEVHWANTNPDPRFLEVIRRNLPSYIRMSSVDVEFLDTDLARAMESDPSTAALFAVAEDRYSSVTTTPAAPASAAAPASNMRPAPVPAAAPASNAPVPAPVLSNMPAPAAAFSAEMMELFRAAIAAAGQTIVVHEGGTLNYSASSKP